MAVQQRLQEASGMSRPIAKNVATGQVVVLTFAVLGSHIHRRRLQRHLHKSMYVNIKMYVVCAAHIAVRTV